MKLDFEEVSVAGLAKSYGPTLALAGVDLSFGAGNVTVIQGSNGSGKSTLLWLLAMLAYPTRGEIRYGQYGVSRADGLRGRIGFVAHQLQLYPGLSGHENLLLAAKLQSIPYAEKRATDLCEALCLGEYWDRPVRTYSRGQAQRVSIARALLHEPRLLLDGRARDRPRREVHRVGRRADRAREARRRDRDHRDPRSQVRERGGRPRSSHGPRPNRGARSMSTLRAAWLVALKDLQLELRTKEILTSTGLFAVLVVTLGSLAFYTDPVSSPNVAPGVLWISILFCGILLIGRSWALERENDAVFGLLLAPIPRASIYIGKTISALVLLFVVELLLVPLCLIFFQIEPSGIMLPLLALVFLGSIGFVSTASLFSAVGIRTRARDLMLSVLVFPLVAPALLASAVATRELFGGATTAEILGWMRILAAFDLLFVGFGVWVSRHLLAET